MNNINESNFDSPTSFNPDQAAPKNEMKESSKVGKLIGESQLFQKIKAQTETEFFIEMQRRLVEDLTFSTKVLEQEIKDLEGDIQHLHEHINNFKSSGADACFKSSSREEVHIHLQKKMKEQVQLANLLMKGKDKLNFQQMYYEALLDMQARGIDKQSDAFKALDQLSKPPPPLTEHISPKIPQSVVSSLPNKRTSHTIKDSSVIDYQLEQTICEMKHLEQTINNLSKKINQVTAEIHDLESQIQAEHKHAYTGIAKIGSMRSSLHRNNRLEKADRLIEKTKERDRLLHQQQILHLKWDLRNSFVEIVHEKKMKNDRSQVGKSESVSEISSLDGETDVESELDAESLSSDGISTKTSSTLDEQIKAGKQLKKAKMEEIVQSGTNSSTSKELSPKQHILNRVLIAGSEEDSDEEREDFDFDFPASLVS